MDIAGEMKFDEHRIQSIEAGIKTLTLRKKQYATGIYLVKNGLFIRVRQVAHIKWEKLIPRVYKELGFQFLSDAVVYYEKYFEGDEWGYMHEFVPIGKEQ